MTDLRKESTARYGRDYSSCQFPVRLRGSTNVLDLHAILAAFFKMTFIHCHSIDAHHLVDLSPHVLRQATDTPTGTQPRCVVEYHIRRRLGSFGITRKQRLRKECLINPQARCAGRNQFEPLERGTWTFSTTMWPIGIFRCGLWLDQSVKVQVVARHRGEYAHEKS